MAVQRDCVCTGHAQIATYSLTTMILRTWLLFTLCSTLFLCVLGQRPTHSITSFANLPGRLFFFDDTETAVYLDPVEGILYVSNDEGKKWTAASGIPRGEAAMVIEHPSDNRFVRTCALRGWQTAYRITGIRSYQGEATLSH